MAHRIVTVVGARPQFVKAAPVSVALRDAGLRETLVHTGQHYDHAMSDVFFDELDLRPPDVHLGVGSGSHGTQTGRMLAALEDAFAERSPDLVLVYGDTNSTLAGALAAVKLHIPVAHVEAGLRSHNPRMPEEINRVLTDHASELLFPPTRAASDQLTVESITHGVHLVGDVMYDAALMFGRLSEQSSDVLERLGLAGTQFALATVHRAESTDHEKTLRGLATALAAVNEELPVVMPLHPRTRAAAARFGIELDGPIHAIDPVGYLDMLRLTAAAEVVITDSGGVQKEAFFQRTPCVTLRTETEWVELLETGWNRLVDPRLPSDVISAEVLAACGRVGSDAQPYGDGAAAARIAGVLSDFESAWFSAPAVSS